MCAFVAAGLAIAGCAGDAPNACDLLSDAEVERILDTPTRPAELDDESLGPGSSCAWISEDSTEEPHAPVYGVHAWLRDDDEARAEFTRRRARPGRDFVTVDIPGLGDDAYFVEDTEPNNLSGTPSLPILYMRVDDDVIGIGTYDSDERPVDADEARAMQRAVARAALVNLGRR
jgi:hypothetical protein